MKKILLVGILSLFISSTNAKPVTSVLENVPIPTCYAVEGPQVIIVGDRIIVIYPSGKVVVLDKDGTTTTIPPK